MDSSNRDHASPGGHGGTGVGGAHPERPREWLFGSLFLGGFEASTHRTIEGTRLDLIAATQHDRQAATDYALCQALGVRGVREAARWPMIDRGGVLDLSEVRRLARLGRETGIVQIWDLMHYGYPDDLDPFTAAFTERFAAYAAAFARAVREETDAPLWVTPVNEISYYSWAGGDVAYMAPFGRGRAGELKRALVRAAIAATDAIWAVNPGARVVSVDPLVRVHAPPGRPDLEPRAEHFNHYVVTEAFDMLAGRVEPELGGSRAHLGVLGFNYYASNQWTIATPEAPQRFLAPDEPAWVPLSQLLAELEARYGGPLVLAETGAAGEGRAAWLERLTVETERAWALGVELVGLCWYPFVSSPDWEDVTASFEGGLVDIVREPDGRLARVLSRPVEEAFRRAQARLDPEDLPPSPPAGIVRDEPPEPLAAPPEVIRLLERARFKPDNFSYQRLGAGQTLRVELYGFEPGGALTAHRHAYTEHLLTVLAGEAQVWVGGQHVTLHTEDSVLVPAGAYHTIHNAATERLVVQQVSAECAR